MEKISANKKKKLSLWKKPITWWLILLAIIMPIATTIATSVLHSPFKNFTTSNDWIGFFGSYMGAIIGGLITLLVMYTTIENGDNNLKITMDQNEEIQNKNNKIVFCNDIATIVAEFCASTRELSINLRMVNQLFKKYEYWLEEYIKRKNRLKEYVKIHPLGGTASEELEEGFQSAEQHLNSSKAEHMDALNKASNYNTFATLFLLKIKLKDIEDAKELIEKVERLNEDIKLYTQVRDNDEEIVKDIKKLDYRINEILEESTKFINKYSKI